VQEYDDLGDAVPGEAPRLADCDVTQSTKLVCLLQMLPKIKSLGEKTVVVSTSTKMLDIAEQACRAADLHTARIDGSTAAQGRQELVNEFNAPNSRISVRPTARAPKALTDHDQSGTRACLAQGACSSAAVELFCLLHSA
jgi:hypothetical protein